MHIYWVSICGAYVMANDDPIRFILSDNIHVFVKKVANNKYDFELTLPNGNRKTFIWSINIGQFRDRKGRVDRLITEAVNKFVAITHVGV